MPLAAKPDEASADLTIATARRVRVKPWFESYALLVPSGRRPPATESGGTSGCLQ